MALRDCEFGEGCVRGLRGTVMVGFRAEGVGALRICGPTEEVG